MITNRGALVTVFDVIREGAKTAPSGGASDLSQIRHGRLTARQARKALQLAMARISGTPSLRA